MAKKFIPNGDQDFNEMAGIFSRALSRDPARYNVQQATADELLAAVERYGTALHEVRTGGRSEAKTRVKDDARAAAEQIIRRLAILIKVDPTIDSASKIDLGMRGRESKAKPLSCPQEPPRLEFVQALHLGSGATPMHELKFHSLDHRNKPAGAVRLELFVDLVPPDEPHPTHPGENLASRPWYLRSYTRSPIRLVPPMARVPMRVVYWGRWADSAGNVGPFSATVVAWVEGGMHPELRPVFTNIGATRQLPLQEQELPRLPGPQDRDKHYSIAVLEAFHHSQQPTLIEAQDETEVKQLEDPAVSEAA